MLRTTRGWQSCSRTTGEGGLRSVHAIGPGPACSHWGEGGARRGGSSCPLWDRYSATDHLNFPFAQVSLAGERLKGLD